MRRRIAALLPVGVLLLAACSSNGGGALKNPFAKKPPFVPSPVPADFAVVVDENHDTFYARQHIQQVITAADAMSRTSYTNYRDYNDSVARRFSQETPLSASQLQAMWNEIVKNEVMDGATPWINWRSDADLYKRNTYTIQVRANGRTRSYRQTNGFSGVVRPVMLLVEAVRLPITQNAGTPVVLPHGVGGPAEPMPPGTASPAASAPAEPPAGAPMLPSIPPAATAPATAP
jgi:hypothetical protein